VSNFYYFYLMAKEINLFKAGRPGEYVAFFTVEVATKKGPAFVYLGCDAFTEYAFNMGVEPNESPENIIKHVYLLTEDKTFVQHRDEGFTLVFDRFEELSDRIDRIIKPVNGRLIYNKKFHAQIAKPLLEGLKKFAKSKRK
jgi:hypothetical protein